MANIHRLKPAEIRAVADALSKAFPWYETAEGHDFWSKVARRLRKMAAAVEVALKVAAKTTTVRGVKVETAADSRYVNVGTHDSTHMRTLTPTEARELADTLREHANAAERRD